MGEKIWQRQTRAIQHQPNQLNHPDHSNANEPEIATNTLRRAITDPRKASAETILKLQQTYGNQAVQRLLKNRSNPAVIQRTPEITSKTADDKEHPLSVLEANFGKQLKKFAYNVGSNNGRISQEAFFNGQQAIKRPSEVVANIKGPRRTVGNRKSDSIQSAIGHLGEHERALQGRPVRDSHTYEGGHLVSDKILGDDSYIEENLTPQLRALNSPAYRKIEMLAEKGLVNKKTGLGTTAIPITMTVTVSYDSDYTVSIADLKTWGVIPSTITKTDNDETSIMVPRRVPRKWKVNLQFDSTTYPNYTFDKGQIEEDGKAGKFFAGTTESAKSNFGEKKKLLKRMGSQEALWGMDSAKLQSKDKSHVLGGETTEKFRAYQSVPYPLSEQEPYKSGKDTKIEVRTQPVLSLFDEPINFHDLDNEKSKSYEIFSKQFPKNDNKVLFEKLQKGVKIKKNKINYDRLNKKKLVSKLISKTKETSKKKDITSDENPSKKRPRVTNDFSTIITTSTLGKGNFKKLEPLFNDINVNFLYMPDKDGDMEDSSDDE